jgi:hypothetical protein
LIRDHRHGVGGHRAEDIALARTDRAGAEREVRDACVLTGAGDQNPRIADEQDLVGCDLTRRAGAARPRLFPRWIALPPQAPTPASAQQEPSDAPDGCRWRHAADVTIGAMTSGGALLIALLLQGPTGASGGASDAPSTRARLELRGAGECISRGDLAARVGARTPRVQFVDDAAIYAQVTLTSARPGNVIAELVLAAPGNDQPSRRFVARSCAEAADAIALIIAVTLDPTLKRTGAVAPGGASGTTEAGTDRAPPPAEKPGAEPAPPPPPAPPAAVESVPPPAPGPATETRRQFAATIAGQTIFGPAPGVLPGIALYGMAALERDGIWAPALFIGAIARLAK